jgi:hypothetical protein
MENHARKTANIAVFYLAHNTLLGLNELTYSRPITYCLYFHSNNYLCRAPEKKLREPYISPILIVENFEV